MSKVYKHVKTGGLYKVLTFGLIESNKTLAVVYQSLQDEQVWIRPEAEFFDGRFELQTEEATLVNDGSGNEFESVLDEVHALQVQLAALYYYVFKEQQPLDFNSSPTEPTKDNEAEVTKFNNAIINQFGVFAESVNKDQQAENQLKLHGKT